MINSPPIQAVQMTSATTEAPVAEQKLVRGLGLLDSTMLVAGSMIGSGIFIVSAIIARQVGAPGWLLVVWIVTGLLTLTAALLANAMRWLMVLVFLAALYWLVFRVLRQKAERGAEEKAFRAGAETP